QLILELTSKGEYRSKTLFLLSYLYEQQGEYEKSIEILQSCISHPIAVSDKEKAMYSLGRIYEVLGNWSESEKQYSQIIEVAENEELKRDAWFHLGVLMKLEVENEEAHNAFQHVIQLGENDSLCVKSFYYLGEISKEQGDFQSAFDAFLSAEKRSIDPEQRLASIFQKAKCLELLGESQQAINEYQKIVDDTNHVESIMKKSIFSIAQLYVIAEVYEKAAYYYKQYLTIFQDDKLTDIVLLRLGKIYFKNLKQFDAGFRTLAQIWDDYPGSNVIPESRFVYAEALNEMGRRDEANQVYSLIIHNYPGTLWVKKAIDRLKEIETYYSFDYREGFSQLAALVQRTLSNSNDPDILFELGEVSYQYLKEYEDAIQYFKSYISLHSQSEKMDEILFQIGQSYEALFFMDKQSAFQDSTKNMYHTIISNFPNSPYAYEAGIRLANLEAIENTLLGYQSYRNMLMKYPSYDNNDEIFYHMGDLSMQNDSLYSALTYFQRVITEYPESKYREAAFYHMGKIHYHIGNYHVADSLFNLYKNRYSDGEFLPEILFYQAKCAFLLEDVESAISLFEHLSQHFYFSPWSDSGNSDLASLYLQIEAYQKAVILYQKMCVEDSLRDYLSSMGLVLNGESQDNENLIGLAKAYEGLKKYKEAKKLYFQLLRNDPDIVNHVFALSSLARIAEEENHISRAVDYLNRIVNEFPADSTVEQLGLLYFRLGQYEKAQELLDQAITLSPSEERKIFISSRAIIALLRQGMIPQADARIAIFEKSYKDDPRLKKFLSELEFEKGLIYSQE
ncbi:tetratricopeptide repeat protein, partial [bacterium]|nr:tetratricopeptide repeat protein [bacterium]